MYLITLHHPWFIHLISASFLLTVVTVNDFWDVTLCSLAVHIPAVSNLHREVQSQNNCENDANRLFIMGTKSCLSFLYLYN
jgi:hypothetical protein